MSRNPNKSSADSLNIALIGTRGVPAAYGGFETAVEQIGQRLVARGHEVTVYCRSDRDAGDTYRGMRRVVLPAVKKKSLETLSHTALSVAHLAAGSRADVAILFNAANSPMIPVLRLSSIPVALHMDGLEWRRSKWGRVGRKYYRIAESLGVRFADSLIADSPGISDYYQQQFGAQTEHISYGAPLISATSDSAARLQALDLEPDQFYLVVARFEPENHVKEIIQGYIESKATRPLVVVGSAPYSAGYTSEINAMATSDDRVILAGAVYDQDLLDALYAGCYAYLHGHSVGGTNPSLLRAIGAGAPVVAYDISFNRHVLDSAGWYFRDAASVSTAVDDLDATPEVVRTTGMQMQEAARERYSWDDVTDLYESLAKRLARGESDRQKHRRLRRVDEPWMDKGQSPIPAKRQTFEL